MWGCEEADLQMWRCEDVDLQMWRCEDVDQQVWGYEDVDQQMWRCEDVDQQMWRCEAVDQQMWRREDVDQQMWGCEDVLQRLLFYEEPFAGALGKNVKSTQGSDDFWKLRCWKCTPLWREAHCQRHFMTFMTLHARSIFGCGTKRVSKSKC